MDLLLHEYDPAPGLLPEPDPPARVLVISFAVKPGARRWLAGVARQVEAQAAAGAAEHG